MKRANGICNPPDSLMSKIDSLTPPSVTPGESRPSSKEILVPLAIFGLAFAVRMFFIDRFHTQPGNDLLWNDAVGWNLAKGIGFTSSLTEPRVPGIFRTPGYPGYLALVYLLFGHSYYAAYVGQGILDSLCAVILYFVGMQCLGKRIATTGGFLYALYPYPAIFCGVLHQDILLVFSVMLVLLILIHALRVPDRGRLWFVLGGAVGFAALVRGNFLLFIVVPAISLLFHQMAGALKLRALLLLTAGFVLLLLPWVVRNYLVFHSFPPLAVGCSGDCFLKVLDELHGEEGLMKRVKGPPDTTLKVFMDGTDLIADEKAKAKYAIPILLHHWPQYCVIMLKHIPRLWLSKYALWRDSYIELAAIGISMIVLAGGLIGIYLSRHQWRRLIPVYLVIAVNTLMQAPYVVEARYTLPARPAMILFVACTWVAIYDALKGNRHSAAYARV